jgi:hypothetical protein
MNIISSTGHSHPLQKEERKWSLPGLVKVIFIGISLLAGGVVSRDLCQQSNIRPLCNGNLGIPRTEMPQLEGEARNAYLFMKATQGHPIHSQTISAHELVFTQSEASREIVLGMLKGKANGLFDPCKREILIARNKTHHKILDGHHTALACRLLNGHQSALIIQDDDNLILDEMKEFPGSFRRNMDDGVLKP